MRHKARQTPAQRLLRVAQWGQVYAFEPTEGAPQIIEEVAVSAEQSPAVLALADRWRAVTHPSLCGIAEATLQPLAGERHAVRITRLAPRGSLLHQVVPKLRAAEERLTAALCLDLARAMAPRTADSTSACRCSKKKSSGKPMRTPRIEQPSSGR